MSKHFFSIPRCHCEDDRKWSDISDNYIHWGLSQWKRIHCRMRWWTCVVSMAICSLEIFLLLWVFVWSKRRRGADPSTPAFLWRQLVSLLVDSPSTRRRMWPNSNRLYSVCRCFEVCFAWPCISVFVFLLSSVCLMTFCSLLGIWRTKAVDDQGLLVFVMNTTETVTTKAFPFQKTLLEQWHGQQYMCAH